MDQETKKCRRCHETIKASATACKHCGSDIRLIHQRHPIIAMILFAGTTLFVTGLIGANISPISNLKAYPVSADEYGDEWPFTEITRGTVTCDGPAVLFTDPEGNSYAMNGLAKTKYNKPFPFEAGIVKSNDLFPEDPDSGTIYADTSVLMELCK